MKQEQEGPGQSAGPSFGTWLDLPPVLRHMNSNTPGTLGWLLSVLHLQRLLQDNRKRVFPSEKPAIS